MESQQIVDYIRSQLAAGHTSDRLKQHLLASGWSGAQVTAAFQAYERSIAVKQPVPTKKKKLIKPRRKRTKASNWTFGKKLAVCTGIVLVGGIAFGVHSFWNNNTQTPVAQTAPVRYTYQQKQAIDVNTLGSTISQYSVSNGVLPTGLSIATDGNLILCGTQCDVLTSEVRSLTTYKSANVKFVAYTSGLTVPDASSMYVVPAATCKNKGTTIDASAAPKAMVILYALTQGSRLTQRCVIL